jgi:DNA modification methylase/predicted RNA-binding Zn-ribbon protein involved in translation (DUF1610 family)
MADNAKQLSLNDDSQQQESQQPVECLGMTFENEAARRAYFLEKLREKLQDPEFRSIEGFPIGEDEDILALSDPPYYTACPNPFVKDFINFYGKPYNPETDNYKREPFAADVSEGKNDSLYGAHGYHTKVPYKAIMRYILHYTEPGDIVLDGFSGSGLTGVAAQMCGAPQTDFRSKIELERKQSDLPQAKWGARRVVLNDIGIAATFIGANYNLPFGTQDFREAGSSLLSDLQTEVGWMYETFHGDSETKGRINYTVWSEVFSCPECGSEIIFTKEALDPKSKRIRDSFPCPECSANLNKDRLSKYFETLIDPATQNTWKRIKLVPIFINYSIGKKKFEKVPDANDLVILDQIQGMPLPVSVPTNSFPLKKMYHGSRLEPKGFTHVHQLFLPRAAQALGTLWQKVDLIEDFQLKRRLLFFVEQAVWGMSVLARYAPTHYSQVNQYLNGVYYVGSQHAECSPWYILEGKLKRLIQAFQNFHSNTAHVTANASTTADLNLPDNSVDYIFTDPPFGENIFYADLNFLVESWHKVRTNSQTEAIIDKHKGKELEDYQHLMQRCFEQYYRVLKPGRWMTMVFHNSKNAVWNAIQQALLSAGFVISTVRTLNKQQGSYRQVTSSAPREDLIVSAYKPNGGLETRFKLEAGTEEGVWDFIQTHLKQLPVIPIKDGCAEPVSERTEKMLYDQMVAFHVQRGITVPLSAAEFYLGLAQRFEPRDTMYFLPEQAIEYDRKKATVKEFLQLDLLVTDEESAIQWIRQKLLKKPQKLQDLTPLYMKEAQRSWAAHERLFDLRELLQENFLCYREGPIPDQIVSWLKASSIHREKIRKIEAQLEQTSASDGKNTNGLDTDDPGLLDAARDHWYIPDPNNASQLEQLREQKLLREFDTYCQSNQRRLRQFRLEAVRAGFKKCWQEKNEDAYRTIVDIAEKIPTKVLEEDTKLFRFYQQAITRLGDR